MNDIKQALRDFEKAKSLKNQMGTPTISPHYNSEMKVHILPDVHVSLGMFYPTANGYLAHPTTIAALKKNIFVTGMDTDLLEKNISCPHCQKELDLQFWHFCPFCEGELLSC